MLAAIDYSMAILESGQLLLGSTTTAKRQLPEATYTDVLDGALSIYSHFA